MTSRKWRALLSHALAAVLILSAGRLCRPPPPARASVHWGLIVERLQRELSASGYRMSPPSRGVENDVVFALQRLRTEGPPVVVEIHVVRRGQWPGALQTPSFGVSWEQPRTSADASEAARLTARVREAVLAIDRGAMTPEAIPLAAHDRATWLERSLEAVATPARTAMLAALLLGAALALAATTEGLVTLSLLLFALASLLRFHHLNFLFTWDQEIQRILSASRSAWWVLTRLPLEDRHPPGFYLLLHFMPGLGTSEAGARTLAALFGSLLAPVLVWLGPRHTMLHRALSAVLALIVAMGAESVLRSREVSELSMHALVSIALVLLLSREGALEPSRGRGFALKALAGLLPWIYYVGAAFLFFAPVALAVLDRPAVGRWWREWLRTGVVLGSPAIVLAGYSFVHDLGARRAAEHAPDLAWGAQSVDTASVRLAQTAVATLGAPCLVLVLGAAIVFVWLRARRGVAVFSGLALTLPALAILAPVARVQPYYAWGTLVALLAVVLTAARSLDGSRPSHRRVLVVFVALAAAGAVSQVSDTVAARRRLYGSAGDAFGPLFASRVLASRERAPLVTLAHFDATLMSYYCALAQGIPVSVLRRTERGVQVGRQRIDSLVAAHQMSRAQRHDAVARLVERRENEPVWIVWRFDYRPEGVAFALRECRRAAETGIAALLFCPTLSRRPPPD